MKKVLVAGLTGLVLLATSSVAMAAGKIGVSYAPEYYEYTDQVSLGTTKNDYTDKIGLFNVDGSYTFSKELSITGYVKNGKMERKIEDGDYVKTGTRTVTGAELTYVVTPQIKVGGFFDYRMDKTADDKDKATRLRYGVRGTFAQDKISATGFVRKAEFEYDDAFAKASPSFQTAGVYDSAKRAVDEELNSPIRMDGEVAYTVLNSKETGKMDAFVLGTYENAEKDNNSKKTSGFGLGVKGSYPIDKLSTTYRLTYSPLSYEVKTSGTTTEYDKNEFRLVLGAEYPITDVYYVKGSWDMYRMTFEKDSNNKWDQNEDYVYVGAGMKF